MDSNMNSTLATTEGDEQFPLYFGNYEALKSIGLIFTQLIIDKSTNVIVNG